ncbi:tetraacyldisaccharide 4'-kinase [Spirosoma fluminis]
MNNWLLLPLSGIYGLITTVRNWLFDNGLFQHYLPSIYTIGVGNLTVGGTGKTPMVEFLIKWYAATGATTPFEAATLSRGYGRQTTGFRIANDSDTAATIGDEPLQLYRKFKQQVRVCVGERRAEAIQRLLELHPETSLILLDDVFQHRAVRPQLTILLMDYNRPFYTDYPFPAGRLREPRRGADRADVVVVTKCPLDLSDSDQERIACQIRQYARPQTPIFFAGLQYGQPVAFSGRPVVSGLTDVVLVSGLANADPLERYVRQTFQLLNHYRFADHYTYTQADLDRIMADLPTGAAVLTTEKDWVKLDALLTPEQRNTRPFYILSIQMTFLEQAGENFSDYLTRQLLKNR